MKPTKLRLTLVSHSPRRANLLALLNIPFDIEAAHSCEQWTGSCAREIARENAARKLRAHIAQDGCRRLFLTADTLIQVGRYFLGKPQGSESAARMLKHLSGRWHKVITGLALSEDPRGKILVSYAETSVRFRSLEVSDIAAYLRSYEWRGKAGAYAIQGRGADFVETIQGSFSNVVGLPLELLERCLGERWGHCQFL
jgi:septum formation protein